MITSRDVIDAAHASGFRSDVVEKVLRLCGILARLDRHPITRGAFDAANLLSLEPDLMENPAFRLAFVCSVAGGRFDPRDLRPSDRTPDLVAVKQ